MHDFEAIKEQIRQRIDLVELVSEHVALTRSGNSFRGLCPFHKEKTPSFHVIPDKHIFHCFGCKAGGDIYKFVQLREGVSFGEALRMLADRAGLELPTHRRSPAGTPTNADLARANAWAAAFFRQQLLDTRTGESARGYLERRGIEPTVSERFGLGLATGGSNLLRAAKLAGMSETLLLAAGLVRRDEQGQVYDTFRDRLVFPIRDTTKRVIGFGGRTLGDAKAKYLNTAQNELFDKGRVLYGLDLARSEIASSGRVIVVEGYTDCIACSQAGFTATVATLGTAMTDAHVNLLRRYGREIVLVFDSDSAGNAAAERALAVALRHGLSVRLAFVPQGKDPAESLQTAGPEAFASMLNSAADALPFVWERTLGRFGEQDGDAGRRQAVLEFVGLVAGLVRAGSVDAIQKGLIANQVAKLLNLRSEQVHDLLEGAGQQRRRGSQAAVAAPPESIEPAAARTAEQAALTSILEVLLNEPALYGLLEGRFDPRRFADPVLCRIGSVVAEMADRLGEFALVEVLDCLSDSAEAQRVTELFLRGEKRGNLEETLRGAAECLVQVTAVREAARLASELQGETNDRAEGTEEDAISARLAMIHRTSHDCSHFAPRGKLSVAREVGR